MKLQIAYIGLVAALSGATAQQFCTDEKNTFIGYAGQREDTIGNSVILDRRGRENCPCSYANIQCTSKIDGEVVNCRDIVINGTEATLGGVKSYPNITLDYSMDICNYNDKEMKFSRAKGSSEPTSFLKFWFPDPNWEKIDIERKEYCDDADCTGSTNTASSLKPNSCLSATQSSTEIQTTYSNFYLMAKMQGPLIENGKNVGKGFCYAYAYEPISLQYDYGDEPCNMHTEISCHVKDAKGNPTVQTCKEKILEMNDSGVIQPFNSIIKAEACNMNDRPVFLQYKPSNFKISDGPKPDPNPKDKYTKIKKKYPEQYNVVDGNAEPMPANNCERFSIDKTIDPLLKNFHQINIQGMLYNNLNDNIEFFRDKDCHSFSFESLPVLDPGAPSSVPSVSMSPSVSMVPSTSPSLSVYPSSSPSALPSESSKPSTSPSNVPSSVPSTSSNPSESSQPSSIPSSSPSNSMKPSGAPSNIPSSLPSSLPSSNPSLSSKPSVIPSDVPSDIPSDVPSDQPSSVPSDVPSDIPSDVPSDQPSSVPSDAPSDIPSDVPSDIPSDVPSDQPSSVPSDVPSDIPSDVPSDQPSSVPSDVPSDIPSNVPSDQPSSVPSDAPSDIPSDVPSDIPSDVPSDQPSSVPSDVPSEIPSDVPSDQPSSVPSDVPSDIPSDVPSDRPSSVPSTSTSPSLSMEPSGIPSTSPSVSVAPSLAPSVSVAPSLQPSDSPSMNPSVSSAPSLSAAPSCDSSKKSAKSCKSTNTSAPTPSPTKPPGGPTVGGGTTDPPIGEGKGKGSTAGAPSKGSTRRLRK